jgi:flagellin
MSLVVNTNVSSLTAQRALAFADSLQGEAMTRLSTGSKINSASDDAAGLAIAQRMTSQVNGLNMAVKNANDGISLTQSVEGALVEVADMLQRMRELSVQAANDTNTGTDRKAIQEEINLLVAEVSRVSSNTRFNNQKVLDGSFNNVSLQVGTEAGETITFGLDSTSSDKLGAYKVTGDIIQSLVGAGSGALANQTDADDDIIINGNSVSKTIDVAALDSSKAVASKINSVSGDTGVTAEAKTHAKVYSMSAADETMSFKINNVTTGDFVMSSTSVSDAIDKINAISGSTGVTATSTDDN